MLGWSARYWVISSVIFGIIGASSSLTRMLATMMRAVCLEMLITLAPRKKPFGTVVGLVSFGIKVVWYQPISFTR